MHGTADPQNPGQRPAPTFFGPVDKNCQRHGTGESAGEQVGVVLTLEFTELPLS